MIHYSIKSYEQFITSKEFDKIILISHINHQLRSQKKTILRRRFIVFTSQQRPCNVVLTSCAGWTLDTWHRYIECTTQIWKQFITTLRGFAYKRKFWLKLADKQRNLKPVFQLSLVNRSRVERQGFIYLLYIRAKIERKSSLSAKFLEIVTEEARRV